MQHSQYWPFDESDIDYHGGNGYNECGDLADSWVMDLPTTEYVFPTHALLNDTDLHTSSTIFSFPDDNFTIPLLLDEMSVDGRDDVDTYLMPCVVLIELGDSSTKCY